MKSADLALYEAKRAGKNVYRIARRTDLSAAAHSKRDPRTFMYAVAGCAGKNEG